MYVTLNISTGTIRILAIKGRQVKEWGSLPLADGLVKDGLILHPEAVGEAIDALFKLTKLPKERVITSLTGLPFTYRFLDLPRMKPALLDEAIQRATRKEISLPLDELYLSWQVIDSKDNEQTFFVTGVARNLADTLMQTLTVAGLEPYIVDLKPLALARAANREDAIVADLEPDCFDIVLIASGIPVIMHTINPRGREATLEDNIRRLTDELNKTVAFHHSSHPGNRLGPTTPLLIAGELATDAATSALLQAEIEYPVAPLIPPIEFPPDIPVALYAVNMGLALKKNPAKAATRGDDRHFHDININILSGKFRKSRARTMPSGYLFFTVFLIMAIGLLFPLYRAGKQLAGDNARLQNELRAVSREINMAHLINEEATKTQDTIREIAATVETLSRQHRSILSARGEFTHNLKLVTETLPPQAYFTAIDLSDELITMQGVTDSPFTTVTYATTLEARAAFSEVRITEIDEAVFINAGNTDNKSQQVESTAITFEVLMKK